jgi:hypothetical protein
LNYLFDYGKKVALFHECCTQYATQIRSLDAFLATYDRDKDTNFAHLTKFLKEFNTTIEKLETQCGPLPEEVAECQDKELDDTIAITISQAELPKVQPSILTEVPLGEESTHNKCWKWF